jgi:hypothetical protein
MKLGSLLQPRSQTAVLLVEKLILCMSEESKVTIYIHQLDATLFKKLYSFLNIFKNFLKICLKNYTVF